MRTLKPVLSTLPPRSIPTIATRANGARRLSASIRDRQKLRVWMKQDGRCNSCGAVVPLTEADLDHVEPLCEGGDVGDNNVQVLCRPCHTDKTSAEITTRAKRRVDVQTEAWGGG